MGRQQQPLVPLSTQVIYGRSLTSNREHSSMMQGTVTEQYKEREREREREKERERERENALL